jgi:nitroreductase
VHITDATHSMTRQEIIDLARAAHLAPSIHNSQPWTFHARTNGLDIYEDPRRGLPGTDPHGRDRLISCGAAVRNAEVAVARLDRKPITALFPQGPHGDHVAAVTCGPPSTASLEIQALYRAISARRTHRRIFMASASAERHLPALYAAVEPVGARLAVLPASGRARFARLLWRAAKSQVQDDAVRAEMREWTRTISATDGVPLRSHGTSPFPVDGLLAHPLPVADEAPPWVSEDLAQGTVLALVTPADTRVDWVQAGRALESVLLTATAAGLVASFLNPPLQQESYRQELSALLDQTGYPQAVLRIGEPLVTVPATPRRPLMEMLQDLPFWTE